MTIKTRYLIGLYTALQLVQHAENSRTRPGSCTPKVSMLIFSLYF